MSYFVTVEANLLLVGIRLGIKLVSVLLSLRLHLALFTFTFFSFAIFAFSSFAHDRRDILWHNVILTAGPGNGRHLSSHLVEGVRSTHRSVLDASLELSLPHIVSHGLPALFLVLPDMVSELFNPIDELCELPEVIQENLPEHYDIPRGCFRLVMLREYLPRLCTLSLRHVLQSPLRFSTRTQTEHVVQLSAPHLLGRCEMYVQHVVYIDSCLFHQCT